MATKKTDEGRRFHNLHEAINVKAVEASYRDKKALGATSEAQQFFATMAMEGVIKPSPSGNRLVTLEDYRTLSDDIAEARNAAYAYAKSMASTYTSFTIGSGQGNFGAGFKKRSAPRDPGFGKITCEIGEFMRVCHSLGITEFNSEIVSASETNPHMPPRNGNLHSR